QGGGAPRGRGRMDASLPRRGREHVTAGGVRSPFQLQAFLREERARVEEALVRATGAPLLRAGLAPQVARAIEHGVLSGGKRLRPVLCAAAYRAGGGRTTSAFYDL